MDSFFYLVLTLIALVIPAVAFGIYLNFRLWKTIFKLIERFLSNKN